MMNEGLWIKVENDLHLYHRQSYVHLRFDRSFLLLSSTFTFSEEWGATFCCGISTCVLSLFLFISLEMNNSPFLGTSLHLI